MAVVLVARTSKMTHNVDCAWVEAQEYNRAVRFTKYDSTVDTEWFTQRRLELDLAAMLDKPRPRVCQYCGCQV